VPSKQDSLCSTTTCRGALLFSSIHLTFKQFPNKYTVNYFHSTNQPLPTISIIKCRHKNHAWFCLSTHLIIKLQWGYTVTAPVPITIKMHDLHLTFIEDSQHNDPYLSCKDHGFPFKHADNNHHFNSCYAMKYTTIWQNTIAFMWLCRSNFSLILNIQNVVLSIQHNEAATTHLTS